MAGQTGSYTAFTIQALNESWRWRIVAQGSDIETGDLESNFLVGELQWQFRDAKVQGWSSAVRFDARISEGDDGAHLLGVNWTSQVPLNEDWSFVGVVLLADQIGGRAADGVFVQTRASLTHTLKGGSQLGLEMFNNYGSTEKFGSLNNQVHTIGPTFSTKLTDNWSMFAGVQIGLTEPARETDLRLWLGRSF